MNSNISSQSPFDQIRHFDEQGNEHWLARELMPLLGYVKWQNFQESIERAKIAAKNSNVNPDEHFTHLLGSVSAKGRTGDDYQLSRYACYLTAMNGDPRKEQIAQAQSYFANKARQAEIIQQRPKTNAELILEMAQQFLEVERRQLELEAKLALEAQKTKELEQLVHQHDGEIDRIFNPDGNYYSIRGYASLKGFSTLSMQAAKQLGKKATKLSNQLGYPVESLPDPRYGKVNVYSHYVLDQVFAD